MTPVEIEDAVFSLEEIRIIISARMREPLGDYTYERKAAGSTTISEWLEQRIFPITGNHGVVVVDGTGSVPHGRTKLENLRASYAR